MSDVVRDIELGRLPGLNARCIAFLGGRGSGKTTSLAEFARSPARLAVVAIDPAGELSRILASDPSFDVVEIPGGAWRAGIGGVAAWMSGRIREGGRVCFDLSDLYAAEAVEAVEAIVRGARTARGSDLLWLFEEAQRYISQKGDKTSEAVLQVAELGRNWRWGCIYASQRPASVDKEALERCDTLFLGRIQGSRDKAAVDDLLAMNIEDKQERAAILRRQFDLETGCFLMREPKHLPTVNR